MESMSRTVRVKEGSQSTAVVDLEIQEIVEEPQEIMIDNDKASNEHDRVMVVLRKLESTLAGYLANHIQEINNLRKASFSSVRPAPKEDLEKQGGNFFHGRKDSDRTATAEPHIHAHVNHVNEFLKAYIENVRVLQEKLQKSDEQAYRDIEGTGDNIEIREATYKSMLDQFNMQLLVSTFTSGLILSWCTVAKVLQIDGAHAQLLYNIGFLLSLLAIVLHFFNILLSGRCVALCSDHTRSKDRPIRYFYHVLETCEQLYLHGMLIFGVAVLEMSFIIFESIIFPAVFCGVVALGIVVLAAGKFRKLSVLYQNMIRLKALAWTLGGRVGGK